MGLVSDYIHPFKSLNGSPSRCRIRIFIPQDDRDTPVVICSEVPNNPGTSITEASQLIAAEVIRYNYLSTPLVWIEHYPPETTDGTYETFSLVTFSSYEVRERRAPYLQGEEGRICVGEPIWKSLDRGSVEVLVGEEV